jgi:hypothetical protein
VSVAVPQIPAESVEYLKVPISTYPAGTDLSDLPVELAVVPDGETPDSGDWETGLWIGTNAAVLIGTGGLVLTPGTYDVWVRITATPETPLLQPGSIHII